MGRIFGHKERKGRIDLGFPLCALYVLCVRWWIGLSDSELGGFALETGLLAQCHNFRTDSTDTNYSGVRRMAYTKSKYAFTPARKSYMFPETSPAAHPMGEGGGFRFLGNVETTGSGYKGRKMAAEKCEVNGSKGDPIPQTIGCSSI